MKSDVILNKVTTIERCLQRIEEVYAGNPDHLKDYTKQDSIILNIQRACEASIDLAMHIVSVDRLGLPQSSREAFDMLEVHGYIDTPSAKSLKAMVGFRNIAVHDYQSMNLDILEEIVKNHLADFTHYAKQIIKG
ncbi:DUF86 domain-containing protein [Geomicrobium sp. JCM 19055]|uniref:type VII toxin-antitoxin system HepT family RNase toxin n=1 Tax=Geomicrobium sp. JCM 19055 TaxID=1460649 RepID=UPI0005A632AB|nr:DUF86 domain-containing protein [Geomicrobium sp. JCM 19055]